MSEYFGPGVSRTLSALERQFQTVVWQKNKPPLDSEFNLMSQIDLENLRETVRSQVHSGFLLDPTRAMADFVTDPSNSNQFHLGLPRPNETQPILTAIVNGWSVPVVGTFTNDVSNLVKLFPPPASQSRIDLVFLEVWLARVAPNPSSVNKPTTSTLWRWGNVEFGGTNLPDDLEDPTIGFETTERVQVQYRLRVYGQGAGIGTGVALDVYPDGLGDPNIAGQGTAGTPNATFPFENMREALGDPGLWRAGDGNPLNSLGTVDGYAYAIPVCAVFRRNSSSYSPVEPGLANQNGGFNRNGSALNRNGATVFTTATLTSALDATTVGAITFTGLAGSGFDTLTPAQLAAGVFIQLDEEILGPISAITATTMTVASRGRGATMAVPHDAGIVVRIFNSRPDGLFADQVADADILDLRHGVTFGDWDYTRLLIHNLSNLVLNRMRSSYKQSSVGKTEGVQVVEVSYLQGSSLVVPASALGVDGPDGIRTTFSDAATVQNDVTVLCHTPTGAGSDPALDTGVFWDVGADFRPTGFISSAGGYANGSVIFLNIGGANGVEGARASFRPNSFKGVRFLSPKEMWRDGDVGHCGNRTPFTLRWPSIKDLTPAAPGETAAAGPMYPTPESNFEKPFLVLGGTLNAASSIPAPVLHVSGGVYEVEFPGYNFDAAGGWWNGTSIQSLDTTGIANPVLRGQRTLFDMLTRGATDLTGNSSEVYLLLYGDNTTLGNNGVVKVIGAGTVGYTNSSATAPDRVRVSFIVEGVSAWGAAPGAVGVAEMRSQYTNAEDGPGGSLVTPSSLAVVLTDIEGLTATKWSGAVTAPVAEPLLLSTSLMYNPGRGAMMRVPDTTWSVSGVSLGTEYLRQSGGALDPAWASATGISSAQTPFDYSHVGSWNRLPSLGLSAPEAPAYGGNVAMYSEQTRESEVFIDSGSKTMVLRPYRSVNMTLDGFVYTGDVTNPTLLGTATYPASVDGPPAGTPKDAAGIFDTTLLKGYAVPPEFMPRFGRQDIPFRIGSDPATFLAGINHLFTDTTSTAAAVTNIVGGQDNPVGTNIYPLYVQTGPTSGVKYGEYGSVIGFDAYQGRLFYSSDVVSSDLGRGMRGIQLPPYLGVARLYGVFDRRDFVAKGGATFAGDRITPAVNPATNLLRTDAKKQTLFILEGGASDVTGSADDHTYIIPSEAIDIRLSPNYLSGEGFEDLEYVVVFACFGFARGFINKNNIVLTRRHNGTAGTPTIPDTLAPVGMTLPLPAVLNDGFFVGYTRTPYQGDPYMTRAGGTRLTNDYAARYGQVDISAQYAVETPLQQFTPSGVLVPKMPNRRPLQVLASVDFYTTLGTGKVGGDLYPGTITDCGHTENTEAASLRRPMTPNDPAWRVVPRTYSEGQPATAPVASMRLRVVTNVAPVVPVAITVQNTVFVQGVGWSFGGSAAATATNIANAIMANATTAALVDAYTTGTSEVFIVARTPGSIGNTIRVETSNNILFQWRTPDGRALTGTATTLVGGSDIAVNAGNGTSLLTLTGMTERLPLGILLQDSDFLCENPLGDDASALATQPAGIQPLQSLLPLAGAAKEYTPYVGGPGQWVVLSDGKILDYAAASETFRLYRGGGPVFVVSEPEPGAPLSWVSGSFPATMQPVVKGGILACKAMLVRNLPEEAFTTLTETTPGDEVQLVIATYGILGDGHTQTEGIRLGGSISPTGYGEGYAAADRYRLEGRPLSKARVREYPPGDADPAVLPTVTPPTTTGC